MGNQLWKQLYSLTHGVGLVEHTECESCLYVRPDARMPFAALSQLSNEIPAGTYRLVPYYNLLNHYWSDADTDAWYIAYHIMSSGGEFCIV